MAGGVGVTRTAFLAQTGSQYPVFVRKRGVTAGSQEMCLSKKEARSKPFSSETAGVTAGSRGVTGTFVAPNLRFLTEGQSPICSETSNLFELLKLHQGLKSIHYELCSGSFTQLQKLVSQRESREVSNLGSQARSIAFRS